MRRIVRGREGVNLWCNTALMNRAVKRMAIGAGVVGGAVAVERYLIAAPRYRGPVSDHFDGERFRNADPSWQSERSFLKWQL